MGDYKALTADFKEFQKDLEEHGVSGMAKRTLKHGTITAVAIVGLAAANYGAPAVADLVSEMARQQVAPLSPEAMVLWHDAVIGALTHIESDVNMLVDSVWTPMLEHGNMLLHGSLVDNYRDVIAKWKPMDLPIGDYLLKARDAVATPDPDSHHAVNRWGSTALKYAFNGIATYAALSITAKTVGKFANSAASVLDSAQKLPAEAKRITKGIFTVVRDGIRKGVAMAMGKEVPASVENPFNRPQPQNKPLEELLSQEKLSTDEVRIVAQKIGRKIDSMQSEIDRKDAELQAASETQQQILAALAEVQERLARAEDPDRMAAIVRNAVAEHLEDEPEEITAPSSETGITLH